MDEHALGADHRVDERRLADVGAPDDRDVHRRLGPRRRRRDGRAARAQDLEELGHPPPVLGGHGHRIAEAQAIEIREPARLGLGVRFVRRQDDGAAASPEDSRDLEVERRRTLACVDDEQDQVRLLDRREHLAAHALDQGLLGRGIEPARVDHRRLPPLEAHAAVEPVARHARGVTDERLPPADETIEERGLADVRATDDRDDRADHPGRFPVRNRGSL